MQPAGCIVMAPQAMRGGGYYVFTRSQGELVGGRVHYTRATAEASYDRAVSCCLAFFLGERYYVTCALCRCKYVCRRFPIFPFHIMSLPCIVCVI